MMLPKQGRVTLAVILLFSCCFNFICCIDSTTVSGHQQHHQKQEASSTQIRRKRPIVRVKASRRHRRLRYRNSKNESKNRDPLERLEREGTIIFTRKKDKKNKEVEYVPDDNVTPVEVPVTTPSEKMCKWYVCQVKKREIPWKRKCRSNKCGACTKCNSGGGNGPAPSPTTSSDLDTSKDNEPMCNRWCHKHRASIELKCTKFRECKGCPFCTKTSDGPTDRDQPQPRTLCDGTSVTFFDDHKVLYDLSVNICLAKLDIGSCQLDCSCCTSYYWWGFDIEKPSEYPDCCTYIY